MITIYESELIVTILLLLLFTIGLPRGSDWAGYYPHYDGALWLPGWLGGWSHGYHITATIIDGDITLLEGSDKDALAYSFYNFNMIAIKPTIKGTLASINFYETGIFSRNYLVKIELYLSLFIDHGVFLLSSMIKLILKV